MKKILAAFLAVLFLTGCGGKPVAEVTTTPIAPAETEAAPLTPAVQNAAPEYTSRFDSVTGVTLSDEGITVNGGGETDTVYTSRDIIYYEDRDAYDSGNPYGEGTDADRHTAEEAAAHTVVNITAPGAYRLSGKLSAGQIRIDLGDDAYEDPDAVVELILSGADITCTVAPAILFLNTYECDGSWSTDSATSVVDTSAAGANLILEQDNTVTGSYVAKIFKDKDGEKKLWKQDGAIYSYMSLNVYGPGSLELTSDNEGLDTELHLTVNGGNIRIFSDNDGINTNEDGVSVTTINGGSLWIVAGLGAEGDGIDSNGFLVINGGTVAASANPASDAGMDSDMGSYIHGGTVIALGSTMDWAESDSRQVTMNLQFASRQQAGSAIAVTREDGTVVFAYAPETGETHSRTFSGAILSSPYLEQGETYSVWTGGTVTGQASPGGIYDAAAVTGYTGGTRQQYTGTDVGRGGPGGMRPEDGGQPGAFGGEMPEDFDPENFTLPEGGTFPEGEIPQGGFGGGRGGERPEGMEGMTPPEGFDGERPAMPEGETFPEGGMPERTEGGFGGHGRSVQTGEAGTEFYLQDKVNAFSGVTAVSQ